MKKLLTAASAALAMLCAGSVFADEHEGDELEWFPVEAFACNFKDGAGREDLDEVVAEWNEWMDANGHGTYFAITMWPEFFGERAFDFAWLGAWSNANEMGKGLHSWTTEGGEVGAKFGEIIDCGSRTQFATAQLKPSGGEDDDGSFILSFSDCSFREDGGGMEAYLAAQEEWNAYADEHGFRYSQYMMFPIYGENVEADYDFKSVSSEADYMAFGDNWQLMADGHYSKSSELFEPVLDCDSARVYQAYIQREMAEDDE